MTAPSEVLVAEGALRSGGMSGQGGRVLGPIGTLVGGIAAVAARDLRGRMRSRRTFLVITVYLMLLAGFAFGIHAYLQRQADVAAALRLREMAESGNLWGVAPGFALSAQVGHLLFSGLMVLQTILILVLAPAFTAGVISSEREHQTLDLLVTTPLSTVGLVVGKLVAALAWVYLLILASVPIMALVFVFGAVGPDDVLRGYLLLVTLAFGMGAVGLFLSAICRRTQTATVLALIVVLVLALGSIPVHTLWSALGTTTARTDAGITTIRRTDRAPEALLWLNPFVGVMDLICTTAPGGYDTTTCDYVAAVTGRPSFGATSSFERPVEELLIDPRFRNVGPGIVVDDLGNEGGVVLDVAVLGGGIAGPVVIVGDGPEAVPMPMAIEAIGDDVAVFEAAEPPVKPGREPVAEQVSLATFGYPRDTFWPRNAAALVALGVLLTLLSTQLVAPTRRLRLRRRGGWSGPSPTDPLPTPVTPEVQP